MGVWGARSRPRAPSSSRSARSTGSSASAARAALGVAALDRPRHGGGALLAVGGPLERREGPEVLGRARRAEEERRLEVAGRDAGEQAREGAAEAGGVLTGAGGEFGGGEG